MHKTRAVPIGNVPVRWSWGLPWIRSYGYGFTDEVVENVIAHYPFTGRCIRERGLESLDFEHGERVEVELAVYDYAGNAAAPVTETIEWPIGGIQIPSPKTSLKRLRGPLAVPFRLVRINGIRGGWRPTGEDIARVVRCAML